MTIFLSSTTSSPADASGDSPPGPPARETPSPGAGSPARPEPTESAFPATPAGPPARPPAVRSPGRWLLAGLVGVILIHGAMIVSTWGPTYWDFGDGNYMYISKRLTEGVTLYKDILAPQPPMHLVIGAGLSALGKALFGPMRRYLAFRAFSLVLRSLTALVLFGFVVQVVRGWGAPGRPGSGLPGDPAPDSDLPAGAVGLAAVIIWLFLPIGFWWQLGYQSEPLEILFLLLAAWGVWRMTPRSLLLAGLASALAAHCNMTAAPYFLCNAVFLAFRRPRRLAGYLAPFFVLYFAIAFAAQAASGGHFWDNVVFNQTGTFPRSDILARSHGAGYGLFDYVVDKVDRMGDKILGLEGVLIAFAGVGVALWSRRRTEEEDPRPAASAKREAAAGATRETAESIAPPATGSEPIPPTRAPVDPEALLSRQRREYLAWTAIGHFLSIGFVAKGGTVDYIFTIGEPYVALFAAVAAVGAWRWLHPAAGWRDLRFGNTLPFLRLAGAAFAVFIAFYPAARYIRLCLDGTAAELTADRMQQIVYLIDHYTKPGDPILAPPFYAIMTDRNVAAEYSENYIWSIKYLNEKTDDVVGPGVEKAQQLRTMLEKKEIPLVILDMAQTGKLPEIREALDADYQLIDPKPYQTLNTQLTFWVPKGRPINHTPGWREGR